MPKLTGMPIEDRMKLYRKAMRLHKERGWGDKRIAKALKIVSVNTVGGWLYHDYTPLTTGNPHMPNLNPSPELSYVIGVISGDGWLSAISIRAEQRIKKIIGLEVKDRDLIVGFNKSLCKVLLKKKPYAIQQRKTRKLFAIRATSKYLYDFLDKGWQNLKQIIEKYPANFIRALADCEGSITFGRIRLYNTDEALLKYVKKLLLKKFNIRSEISVIHGERFERSIKGRKVKYSKPVYALSIASKDSLMKFRENIGFSIARKDEKLQRITMENNSIGEMNSPPFL